MLLCAVIALTLFAPVTGASTTPPANNMPVFKVGGTAPTYAQGQTTPGFTITLDKVRNDVELTHVYMEMQITGDLSVYPFRIDAQSYASGDLGATGPFQLNIPPQHVRGDAVVNYYDLPVTVYYTGFQLKDDGTGTGALTRGDEINNTENLTFRVLIGPGASSSGGDGVTHIPKVIVSSFSTNPAEVVAGEDFTLNVTFKNTSSTGAVSNMKALLTSEVFNPVAGSSTLFVSTLSAGASKSVSIKLHAKADAAPGSYAASFALSYDVGVETKDNAGASDTEVISIPVKQVPKLQVSTMQVVPSEIFVGNDVNIMTSVNNTGKSTLYNVNVKITDTAGFFTAGEQYLGNLQSGASGPVDLYITPQAAGNTVIQLNVSYEDENGKVYNASQTFDAMIMEKNGGGGAVIPPDMIDPYPQDQKGGAGWWLWLVLGLVLAGIATLVLVKRRKAKVRAQRDRMEAKQLEESFLRSNGSNEVK